MASNLSSTNEHAGKEKNLFRVLLILSLPAYTVLLISLVLLVSERFFSGLKSDIAFYVVVYTVYFVLYLWWGSIASTVGVLCSYTLLIQQRDVPLARRRWAGVIALSATVAFAISLKTVPLIIPAP